MGRPNRKQILDAMQNAYTSSEGFFQNQLTLNGSLQQLSFPDDQDSSLLATSVTVISDIENENYLYVGNSETSETNFFAKIVPGDSVSINIDNPRHIYVLGTAGEIVTFGGELFEWLR
mgnify:CR=1 FL=1